MITVEALSVYATCNNFYIPVDEDRDLCGNTNEVNIYLLSLCIKDASPQQ